jgi:DNA (cytosine-5)-methyltransferase 1
MQAGKETNREAVVDLDLFAGAGGLAIGLEMAGFSPARLYELDKHSCATLRTNTKSPEAYLRGKVYEEDVTKIEWAHVGGPIRLLASGTPCQPFSLGGKHLADHDGRNLFPEVTRAVRELRPAAVLLENVKGLLRKSFQPYFEYVLRQLACPSVGPKRRESWQNHNDRIRRHQCSAGYEPEYHVEWRMLDAADFGVPQNRKRVFIVATRYDLPIYRFPTSTHSREALAREQSSGEYWERHGLPRPDIASSNGALFDFHEENPRLPWVTVRDVFRQLPEAASCEQGAWMNHWLIPGARSYRGHVGSVYDWPSKTIKAGVHGVPGGENTVIEEDGTLRYYTLRETAKLQTFPDTYFFEGARIHVTRQVGNAVPCTLARVVAEPLHDLLWQEANKELEEVGG